MILNGLICSWLLHFSPALAIQKPLVEHEAAPSASSWNFNYSSEAPHYFASAYGLLQQWSNTFFPNGHSIVPCEIAAFTKLFHGRRDGEVPPSPEWVAFDIGMAYGIMGSSRDSHMLTYQTTRRVRCIYFDGESATLFGSGQLDTQMLHIWGNLTGPDKSGERRGGLFDEYARAIGLCDWLHDKELGGPGWGFEGIVRMNAGFEMIWCNFSSPSIRLVSHLNITAPLLPPVEDVDVNKRDYEPTSYFPLPPSPTRSDKATDPSNPPRPPVGGLFQWKREPFVFTQAWNWGLSAITHYGSSADGPGLGETRVKPIGCGFLSYYSPFFKSEAVPRAKEEHERLNLTEDGLWTGPGVSGTRSIALEALMRRRRLHTLEHIGLEDATIMKADSERVLRSLLKESSTNCSGMDWSTLTNDIVQTYADPLFSFLKTLQTYEHSLANQSTIYSWMANVRDLTHTFLVPFLEYPDMEDVGRDIWTRNSSLFRHTYSQCRFQHTRLLDPDEGVFLGPEELQFKWAVEETMGGICAVIVEVGLAVEGLWQSKFNVPMNQSMDAPDECLSKNVQRWKEGFEELMSWLGWVGEWTGCEQKCAWDEKCYIPMWPIIPFRRGLRRGGRPPGYPGYSVPGYGGAGPYPYPYPYHGIPTNGTGSWPGRGFNPWAPSEEWLWKPICVGSNFLNGP